MSFFGHSGKVTGYNYDYLEKISEYTGWEMEYVPYGSTDGNEAVGSAISDLQGGKADLLGPLLKTRLLRKCLNSLKTATERYIPPFAPSQQARCMRTISIMLICSVWGCGKWLKHEMRRF